VKPGGYLLCRLGFAEVVSLSLVAAKAQQQRQGVGVLVALGNNPQSERVGELDRGLDDHSIPLALTDISDK
jgi:hypothetical protein